MKTYREHHCQKRHKSHRAFAQCAFRSALWVDGPANGKWALVSNCGHSGYQRGTDTRTVTLWVSKTQAQQAKERIDQFGCGGRCHKAHEIVRLVMPEEPEEPLHDPAEAVSVTDRMADIFKTDPD